MTDPAATSPDRSSSSSSPLPCPDCGDEHPFFRRDDRGVWVGCLCGKEGPCRGTEAEAVREWDWLPRGR